MFALGAVVAPAAEAGQPYEKALLGARLAMKTRDHDRAARLCLDALGAAAEPWYGGPRSVEAASVCAEVELERGSFRGASRRLREAAHHAIHDWGARRELLVERRGAATTGGDGPQVDEVDRLLEADATVQKALARPDRQGQGLFGLLEQLTAADEVYAADRDRAFAALARGARALVLARSGRALETLDIAEPLVSDDQPPRVREAALEAVFLARLAGQDTDGLARAAVDLDALRRVALPPEARPHARSAELEAACALYEARHGRGRCTVLELSRTGSASLTDWSRGWRARLTRDDLELVHRQGFPALEACVFERARAESATFRRAEIELSWGIGRDGVPFDLSVLPGRVARALDPCLDRVVRNLRYPRAGEPERARVRVPYRFE